MRFGCSCVLPAHQAADAVVDLRVGGEERGEAAAHEGLGDVQVRGRGLDVAHRDAFGITAEFFERAGESHRVADNRGGGGVGAVSTSPVFVAFIFPSTPL